MTIIVGYVPTPVGETALIRAGEEARLRGERLVVVSSSRGDSTVDPTYPQTSALQRMVAKIRSDGVDCEIRNLEHIRDAAQAILDVAEDVGADLIVLGLKRRSPVGKLLLGSTTQRVLLDAPCSVLAVKA
jgi:nucleotide-binding universal stress UspA family protein